VLNTISGSGSIGDFLNPACAFDALELDAATGGPAIPPAPHGLVAPFETSTRIQLTWIRNSTNEGNFLIERSTINVHYALIGAVLADVTSFTDIGVSPSGSYFYRVRAANSAGNSAYSNTGSASRPLFTSASLSGTNLVLTGGGGAAAATFYLLSSSDPAQPRNAWARVQTNQFKSTGGFIVPNPITAGSARQFYFLELPCT